MQYFLKNTDVRITSLFIPVKKYFYVFSDLKIIFIGGFPHLLDYILPNPCN